MTRPRKNSIVVNVNWNDIQNKPSDLGSISVTFENLNGNGDVGTGADQVAAGNHDHNIGNQVLLFENALI